MDMDLWATSDNQLAAVEAGRQGHVYPRRLSEQVVVPALRAWLLNDYAAAYCRSLASIRIFRRCYWLDALGSDARAQSAGLAPVAALSRTLAQESKPIALHGLVLEAGSSRRKETRTAQATQMSDALAQQNGNAKGAAKSLPKESGMLRASWLEAAPSLLQAIEQSPAIFLLNPFGQTLFAYDDLAPLYQRTGPTELCLLLSHRQLGSHLLAASRSLGTPGAAGTPNASVLTTLLRTDRWKTLLDGGEQAAKETVPAQAVDGLIGLFVASMKQRFLTVQRVALPMQVGPATVENAPYTLVFATRRQDSLAAMNDAVCIYQRRVFTESYQGVLGEAWFLQQQQQRLHEEQQQLRVLVQTQGQALRPRRWPELRQHLALAHFGRWLIAEYDTAIQHLLASGTATCEWRRKPIPTENTPRIPSDEDTLSWKT